MLWLRPQRGKLRIVDKDLGRVGRIRSVFEIIPPPVQQNFRLTSVECGRRECIVMMIYDHSFRRVVHDLCYQLSGRKQRIEANERKPGTLELWKKTIIIAAAARWLTVPRLRSVPSAPMPNAAATSAKNARR